jgi:hypothetical protein
MDLEKRVSSTVQRHGFRVSISDIHMLQDALDILSPVSASGQSQRDRLLARLATILAMVQS